MEVEPIKNDWVHCSSPDKTMEVEPINDKEVHCRQSFSHCEKVQIMCHVCKFMQEHSTSVCKAISEMTSISHTEYFCWKKQLNLLKDAKNWQACSLHALNPHSWGSSLSFMSKGLPSPSTRLSPQLPNQMRPFTWRNGILNIVQWGTLWEDKIVYHNVSMRQGRGCKRSYSLC